MKNRRDREQWCKKKHTYLEVFNDLTSTQKYIGAVDLAIAKLKSGRCLKKKLNFVMWICDFFFFFSDRFVVVVIFPCLHSLCHQMRKKKY